MSFWLREIAGWVVLVIGLVVFVLVYDLLLRKRVLEAGPLAFIGFVIFRGGIHLLKVAMAVRATRDLNGAPQTLTVRRSVPVNAPRVTATESKRVLPGPKGI